MVILFYGENFSERNTKKNQIIESLKNKRPDSIFLKVSEEEFGENFIKQNLQSVGLFDDKNIFEINGCFAKKENESLFQNYIDEMISSENAFIFSEDTISIKTKNLLPKKDIKVFDFSTIKNRKAQINLFEISDLFLSKDKKNIWIKYREFIDSGVSPEELFGILFWSVKTLNIVANSKSIDQTAIKPFVYNKTKKFASNWKEGEPKETMKKMISVYHESRRGLVDFKVEIEKIVLS